MRFFAAIFWAIFLLVSPNTTSADMARFIDEDPYQTKIKSTIKASINEDSTISISFKFPDEQVTDYKIKICKDINDIEIKLPDIDHELTDEEKRARILLRRTLLSDKARAYSSKNPDEEDVIKSFEGTFDGKNDIQEKFEYKSPEEGNTVRYFLLIEYVVKSKNTPYGNKKVQNASKESFWYFIDVTRKDGKDNAAVIDPVRYRYRSLR